MAIGSFTMPATRTRLRGISRVHQAQRNARPGCFVGKVHPQLVESPGVPFVAVFAASHCPIPDAGEVFQGQCLARYDGFVYQGLGNAVIDVFHVAALPSTHLFEATFGRFGADPLQGGAAGDVATAGLPHGRARKALPGTVCCDMDQTQVDADSRAIFRGGMRRSRTRLGDMQRVDAAPPDQFRAANLPGRVYQHVMLPLSWEQTTGDASPQGIERDAVKRQQAVGTRIIANAAARPKLRASGRFWRRECLLPLVSPPRMLFSPTRLPLRFLGLRRFDRLHRLRAGADRELRAQPEASAGFSVDAVMRRVGVGDAFLPTHGGNPGRGGIELLLRLGERGFIPAYVQLDADSSCECFAHKRRIVQVFKKVKKGGGQGDGAPAGAWQFLPVAKARGLLATYDEVRFANTPAGKLMIA